MKNPAVPGRVGYELVRKDVTLFAYEVLLDQICRVTVNLYARDGTLVAESRPDEFLVHRGPAKIGRGGILIR